MIDRRTPEGTPPRIGIIGGGQLARMSTQAATRMGFEVRILERYAASPAGSIAHEEFIGSPADHDLLRRFAADCDVVTLESEFHDEADLAVIADSGGLLYPTAESVGLIQDKLTQKQTIEAAGVPVAPYAAIPDRESARAFGEEHGYPFLLKSRRGGYDGYGNATIRSEEEIARGWASITDNEMRSDLYAEAFVDFVRELAVMVVRGVDRRTLLYPVVETVQKDHICHVVIAPSETEEGLADVARDYAQRSIEAIDGVGIFGVELFETTDGRLLVNELAPRPHNSGHYTIEACVTSQFENHVRAVLGLPLGSTALRRPAAVMVNLLGDVDGGGAIRSWDEALEDPEVHLHLYGKSRSRPGRKMGHMTMLGEERDVVRANAERIAETIGFTEAAVESR